MYSSIHIYVIWEAFLLYMLCFLLQVMGQGNILLGSSLTMKTAQKTFSLAVSRDMAPAARVLVYAIVDGEILTDAINFNVRDTRLYKVSSTRSFSISVDEIADMLSSSCSIRVRFIGFSSTTVTVILIIKHPARDTCLYMGEATPLDPLDSPDAHFLFAIALQP